MFKKIISDKKISILFATIESAVDKTGGLGVFSELLPRTINKAGHDIQVVAPLTNKPILSNQGTSQFTKDVRLSTLISRVMKNNIHFNRTVFSSRQPIVYTVNKKEYSLSLLGFDQSRLSAEELRIGTSKRYSDYNTTNMYSGITKEFFEASIFSDLWEKEQYMPSFDKYSGLDLNFMKEVAYFNWLVAAYDMVTRNSENRILHLNEWHLGFYPLVQELLDFNDLPPSIFTLHNIFNPIVNVRLLQDWFGIKLDTFYKPLDKAFASSQIISTVSKGFRNEFDSFPSLPKVTMEDKQIAIVHNGYEEAYDICPSTTKPTIPSIRTAKAYAKNILLKSLNIAEGNTPMLISFVHRWDSQKCYVQTMEAINELLKDKNIKDNVIFVATTNSDSEGDKKLREYMEETHKGSIFIINYKDEKAIDIFKASDLFLFPSIFEPFGIQAVNAFASATPVLAHNVGGLKDIVNDTNGFIFDGFESGTFNQTKFKIDYADTLRKAIDTYLYEGWEKYVLGAYRSKDQYTWYEAAQGYIKLYGELQSN